jgi:hypothetical protein
MRSSGANLPLEANYPTLSNNHKNMSLEKIPDRVAKNQFLFLASLVLISVVFLIVNKTNIKYINLGLITFLYFYALFLTNSFFMKVIYKEKPREHSRWKEYVIFFLFTALWLIFIFKLLCLVQ